MSCLNFKMLVIELLNLINVVGNIFFLDAFLGGEFSAYGIEVCTCAKYSQSQII